MLGKGTASRTFGAFVATLIGAWATLAFGPLLAAQQPVTTSKTAVTAPEEVASHPAPQQISADRIWAEWMIRMGGAVVLEGQRKPMTDLADLPPGDFRIHTLNFTGITMYGASLQDELRHLPVLPHLKELYINGRLWYDQPAPRLADTMGL